ncbi:hypothetical protein X943_002430 [Babesia divergens]|uniref:CDT1 Geminin-binding domain-containing protein n=1 Tax=Babesia divergens TaxID=32595 RepID=A0AAD9LE61_BABDI|nr:hypothetical protein X943_002430 [Babesia divergens]
MEPLLSPDSYIAESAANCDDKMAVEVSISDSVESCIEDSGDVNGTSALGDRQEAEVADVSITARSNKNGMDTIVTVTPRCEFETESLIARHNDNQNVTSSPKTSMRDHIQRCKELMTSPSGSAWLRNNDESPLLCDEEPALGSAVPPEASLIQMEGMRTPPLSPKHKPNPIVWQSNTTSQRKKGLYVNVTDDFNKNPILASSVRSVRMDDPVDQEDVQRSLRVLGASRCWTDRFEDGLHVSSAAEYEDEFTATQTPIRSLTSYIPTSQSSCRYESMQRSPVCQSGTPKRVDVSRPTHTGSAVRTSSVAGTPNRYTREMFGIGEAIDLDMFDGATLDDMRREEVNPMACATLPKNCISEARMGSQLATLYKHFKNMCTFIRRSSMRNDRPYFKVVQLMVQRMTRKSFTMDHLRQIAWLAPNLVSFKWVSINELVRSRYVTEYKDCHGDVVHDVQIRIHKMDGRICASTTDFENTCLSFKTIICAWVARAEALYVQKRGSSSGFDPDMALPIPMATLPSKQSGCVDISGDDTMSPPMTTPTHAVQKLPHKMSLDTTRSTAMLSSQRWVLDIQNTGSTDVFKSPQRPSMKRAVNESEGTPSGSEESSNKRSREITMSPISKELLDTPGMRRIRENTRRLSAAASSVSCDKKHDVTFWKDVRWFLNALVQLSIDEERPPFMRLERLAEFITKYSSRRVTYDNVSEWANTIAQLAPDVIHVGMSKFDDYSKMIKIQPNAKFETIIQYVNQQIDKYS